MVHEEKKINGGRPSIDLSCVFSYNTYNDRSVKSVEHSMIREGKESCIVRVTPFDVEAETEGKEEN